MAVISVNENNQTTDNQKSVNWFLKFFCLFKRKSKSNKTIDEIMSILELTSRLLTTSELGLILEHLPEDSYETNANQTIYSLKCNGKPFFIDYSQYNYDIYSHQTCVGNGIYFCDKHRDLMYVLRILFYEQTISQITTQELEYILKVLPKSYYEVNANQTIYSFKLNGKPFFIDKSHYNYEEYSSEAKPSLPLYEKLESVNEIIEETDIKSKGLGEKYAERNRKVFIKLKTHTNDFKQKLIQNSITDGLNGYSYDIICDKTAAIPRKTESKDTKELSPKANKWSKSLAKRRVYQKSDLMIQTISSKEAKHILNKCKESLFDWSGRNERRKRLELKAKLSSVNNCDLLSSTLYAICEAIEEPNDMNHNSNR